MSGAALEPKERADLCYKLAERAWNRFQDRRRLEWRNAFGIWTLLAAATAVVATSDFPVDEWAFVVGATFAITLVGLFDAWCLWLEKTNADDTRRSIHWETQIIDMVDKNFPWKPKMPEENRGIIPKHRVYRMELCLAGVLALLFVGTLLKELEHIDFSGGPVMSWLAGILGGVVSGAIVCALFCFSKHEDLKRELESLRSQMPQPPQEGE